MPYYAWSGITLEGTVLEGHDFARSIIKLEKKLLSHSVGLISARKSWLSYWYTMKFMAHKHDAIEHISVLLAAHVPFHTVCDIISQKAKDASVALIFQDINDIVCSGGSVSQAFEYHSDVFSELDQALIQTGEQSSDLSKAFLLLSEHLKTMNEIKKQAKQALFMPALTFAFFILVLLALFIGVIPRFEQLFQSVKGPLPFSTQLVFSISHLLRSVYGVFIIGGFIGGLIALYVGVRHYIMKYASEQLFNLPIIGSFIMLLYQARWLHMLSLLLDAGVSLARCFEIMQKTATHRIYAQAINTVLRNIYAGHSLSDACAKTELFCSHELLTLVSVGESSSNLDHMMRNASLLYQKRVYAVIMNIVTIAQPLLLMMLGLCIAGLIFAVYVPLITLSDVI